MKSKAYILLESLIALSLLTFITTVVLVEIDFSHQQSKKMIEQNEELNIAQMAMDSEKTNLSLNGVTVHLSQSEQELRVEDIKGEEVIHLKIMALQN